MVRRRRARSGVAIGTQGLRGGVYALAATAVIRRDEVLGLYRHAGFVRWELNTDIFADGDMYVSGIASAPFRKAQASGRMVNGVFVPAPAGVFVDANFKLQARPR